MIVSITFEHVIISSILQTKVCMPVASALQFCTRLCNFDATIHTLFKLVFLCWDWTSAILQTTRISVLVW